MFLEARRHVRVMFAPKGMVPLLTIVCFSTMRENDNLLNDGDNSNQGRVRTGERRGKLTMSNGSHCGSTLKMGHREPEPEPK